MAFVVAGLVIVAGRRGDRSARLTFGALVAATGVGSVIQHGPAPAWADLAHDLPMAALIAYVVADAAADLIGRRLSATWWVAPTLVLVPVIMASPLVADVLQAVMAAAAVGLSLVRARLRPRARRAVLVALSLLVVGATIGTLPRIGLVPETVGVLSGHAIWHVLAAAALSWFAPVVVRRRGATRQVFGRESEQAVQRAGT